MPKLEPTERFSDRVADYVSYRPDYPKTLLAHLAERCGLRPNHTVADIGSGTGLLTRHFLENGNRVYGIEPNTNMRRAAEQLLQAYSRFTSICGQAEATTLSDQSVDWIAAGQAFHWFNPDNARQEFERILTPKGRIVLVWNDRLQQDPFQQAYETFLLTHCADYSQVNHRRLMPETLANIFASRTMEVFTFENAQTLDYTGLQGRLLSCSYAPKAGAPNYDTMMADLKALFEHYSHKERLIFRYQTKLYYFATN